MVNFRIARTPITQPRAEPFRGQNDLWLQAFVMYDLARFHQGSPCLARSGRSPSSLPTRTKPRLRAMT
jgi:hypothetical protein